MQLTFIPSDFVNLQNPILANILDGSNDSTDQFGDIDDCPFMRAIERSELEYPKFYVLKFNIPELNSIREQLLAGAESVTVQIEDK